MALSQSTKDNLVIQYTLEVDRKDNYMVSYEKKVNKS